MFDEHSEYTDYGAGFMTIREKHWLAGIQTIQFHNNNPLEEDYYFTVVFYTLNSIVLILNILLYFVINLQMYQKRHHGSSGPKLNSIIQQPDTQSKFNNTSYTQLHFENSLGKVLVCYLN